MSEIPKEAAEVGHLVLETQKDGRQLSSNEDVQDDCLNQPRQQPPVLENAVSESTNQFPYYSTGDNSDTASSSRRKKKKTRTTFRETENDFADESSNSDVGEPPQQSSRHKRWKMGKKSDGDHTDDDAQPPGTLRDIRRSFDTMEKYVDELIRFLRDSIKYVTDEQHRKELQDKMKKLQRLHKKNQKGFWGG